jgi:hypothetical protein
MRSKNEVLCAVAGRLAAERSEADKPAKAHKTIFAPNNIYYFFSNLHNKLIKTLRNQVEISNDLASLLYCRSSAEIITSRTPSAEIITLSAARQLVRCHDNEVTL